MYERVKEWERHVDVARETMDFTQSTAIMRMMCVYYKRDDARETENVIEKRWVLLKITAKRHVRGG